VSFNINIMKKLLILCLMAVSMTAFAQTKPCCGHHNGCQHNAACCKSDSLLNIPVYIVDGVEVININEISPDDIESMEVIKDPALCALFAPRVGGIIKITTKSKANLKKTLETIRANELERRKQQPEVRIR